MKVSIAPLAVISCGKKVKIVSIVGGRGVREHLLDVGLNVGVELEVLGQGGSGPFLIAVKETRLAIGQGVARKIMVSQE
ncbi:MAG: ferrous iron transport protein A [Candidatus Omnitrophica bacterium]|nr:ferrous iron transport protein A [Candidatus Omnitrophota bacterium]